MYRSPWSPYAIITLILVLAFGSLATVKYYQYQHRSTQQRGENQVQSVERQQIRRFWDTYQQASQARREGNLSSASELYAKALQNKPEHEDSLYYMGNCLFELGKYKEALDVYQKLVSENPEGSSRGYMRIGLVHGCLDPKAPFDLEKAERAFRQAIQTDPDSGALLNLGETALLKGKWQEAWDALYGFNTDNAMNPAPAYLLGYLKWRQRNQKVQGQSAYNAYKEAWNWFQTSVRRHEIKKPPIKWSEEGDFKASPELRWKAMAMQSIFGEYWLKLRPYLKQLKNSQLAPSMMDQEYQSLDKLISSFRGQL